MSIASDMQRHRVRFPSMPWLGPDSRPSDTSRRCAPGPRCRPRLRRKSFRTPLNPGSGFWTDAAASKPHFADQRKDPWLAGIAVGSRATLQVASASSGPVDSLPGHHGRKKGLLGIPTVDQRWLILPRYTQPALDSKATHREAETTLGRPTTTAPCGAKRGLRNRGASFRHSSFF